VLGCKHEWPGRAFLWSTIVWVVTPGVQAPQYLCRYCDRFRLHPPRDAVESICRWLRASDGHLSAAVSEHRSKVSGRTCVANRIVICRIHVHSKTKLHVALSLVSWLPLLLNPQLQLFAAILLPSIANNRTEPHDPQIIRGSSATNVLSDLRRDYIPASKTQ